MVDKLPDYDRWKLFRIGVDTMQPNPSSLIDIPQIMLSNTVSVEN
jgi:hypothetical protein